MIHPPTSADRSNPDDDLPYFGQHIDLVPDGDLPTIMERQAEEVRSALMIILQCSLM